MATDLNLVPMASKWISVKMKINQYYCHLEFSVEILPQLVAMETSKMNLVAMETAITQYCPQKCNMHHNDDL